MGFEGDFRLESQESGKNECHSLFQKPRVYASFFLPKDNISHKNAKLRAKKKEDLQQHAAADAACTVLILSND